MVRKGILGILTACTIFHWTALGGQQGPASPLNSYIVQVSPGADPAAIGRGLAQRTAGRLGHVYTKALNGFSIQLPPGLARQAIEGQPGVLKVELDAVVHAMAQTLPTGIDRIEVDRNNTANINGNDERVNVDIAIIDTGIDRDHPDLNVVGGTHFYSILWFIFQDDQYDDDNGHGTHVAGIAAALDNGTGAVGVAPGARLWAVKVLDSTGSGYVSDLIAGVDWVTGRGDIEVANMSLAAVAKVDAMRTAIQNSVASGVVFVAAAGNSGQDVYGGDGVFNTSDDYIPAAYPEVAAISALCDLDGQPGGAGGSTSYGSDDSFASFSNYSRTVVAGNPVTSPGKAIDLLLPGVSIYSCWMGGGYNTISGTSMASPHGAGLAALYIAEHGRATSASGVYSVRQALIDAGVDQADATHGLSTQNDPDGNKEKIGWAASAQTEPFTDVAVLSVEAPASTFAGTVVSVAVTVRNTGNQDAGAFNVTLTDNDAAVGSQSVAAGLAPGASTALTYSWDTTGRSSGSHTLTAGHDLSDDYPANDSASALVTIMASLTDIAVTSVTGPASVTQGDSADIVVTVENAGNQDVTSDIAVTLEDTTASQTIGTNTIEGGLLAGASTTVTFSWNTDGASLGDHTLTATQGVADDDAANDAGSTTVKVVAPTGPPVAHVGVMVMPWATTRKGWQAAALVTVLGDDGLPIYYARVEGRWSGLYKATVAGSTDDSGMELFVSKTLGRRGTVTFTVTRIVGQDGRVYELDPPEPSDYYTGP